MDATASVHTHSQPPTCRTVAPAAPTRQPCVLTPPRPALPCAAEGVKAEDEYAKDGTLPDPNSTDNPEFKIVLGLIRDGLAADPLK